MHQAVCCRKNPCYTSTVASGRDRRPFNIYIDGGYYKNSPDVTVPSDKVHDILPVPSFTWIKAYSGAKGDIIVFVHIPTRCLSWMAITRTTPRSNLTENAFEALACTI